MIPRVRQSMSVGIAAAAAITDVRVASSLSRNESAFAAVGSCGSVGAMRIRAAMIRYDVGEGPDLLGRRLRDIDVKQGHLYGLLHRGRGLLLDRTEGLTVG